MVANRTQANRLLEIDTPLGKDELILTGFTGAEAVSTLFNFNLEMVSNNMGIAPKQLIGKPVSFLVRKGQSTRYFHGIVNCFHIGPPLQSRKGRYYRAEVVPWLWFLTRTTDCRIYQNKTAKDIIIDVFNRFNFSDYSSDKIQRTQQPRDYCVQYQETAYDFVSRLMEQEGIFYYFKHTQSKHTLVLADTTTAFEAISNQVNYITGSFTDDCISEWEYHHNLGTGKETFSYYDFERPNTKLQKSTATLADQPEIKNYEYYEYIGSYDAARTTDDQTSLAMQAIDAESEIIEGTSTYECFMPGNKFDLKIPQDTELSNEQKTYLLIQVSHQAIDSTHFSGTEGTQSYLNHFSCIPTTANYRSPRITNRPYIYGLQTAIVVGPPGEEICTDEYGRIKVQFFWDRLGKNDDKSSCWIRVAQSWAGKQWGAIFTPRIGQEVVVSFLDGDPDQPLVIGSVYNADQKPPYSLPTNSTQSGIKTHSSKEGGADDANEIRFEDKKGEELLFVHAQKDFTRLVENDDKLEIKNNQSIKIYKDRTILTDGKESTTVKQDRTIVVLEGAESITIKKGDRTVEINTGNESVTIAQGNQTTKISSGKSTLEAGQGIELTVGQNSIKIDTTSITIQAGQNSIKLDPSGITQHGMQIGIKADTSLKLEGAMAEVDGSGMLTLKGALTMIN